MIIGPLHTVTHNPVAVHLGLALDLSSEAEEAALRPKELWHPQMGHARAISSIVHAFSGLESAVEFVAYLRFSDPSSHCFMSTTMRSFSQQKLIQQWPKLPLIDKLFFLASTFSSFHLRPREEALLRELNLLRNWLVHGFCYQTTLLLEKLEDGNGYRALDQEDSVEWGRKFPNTRFNALAGINYSDSRKALSIVLTLVRQLAVASKQPFSVLSYRGGPDYRVIFEEESIVSELLGPFHEI